MSDTIFPASLRPIVNKGYSQVRGGNIWRNEVQGGVPRQGRDTYFEPVPLSITLVVSSLGRQAFWSFINNIDGGASSFIMPNDTGYGVQDHLVWITSAINDSTDDGKNWTISFTATAERTAIQEDNCLTANLPDLFGCYGDCLGGFLKAYGVSQTTFPRIWGDFPVVDFNYLDGVISHGMSLTRSSTATYVTGGLLKYAAIDEPRFDGEGMLIEDAGTNLIATQSFSSTGNLTVTPNQPSPDGANNAQKLVSLGSPTSMKQFVSTGNSATTSWFFKMDGNGALNTLIRNNSTSVNLISAIITVTGGVASTDNPSASKLKYIGNGWYRHSLTVSSGISTGDSISGYFGLTGGATSGRTFTLFGLQGESTSLPSSYIPTSGSVVTRQPDNLTTTLSNIKRLRRVYIPTGQDTAIDETVPYTGTLCPNGHLQLLQLWDTE